MAQCCIPCERYFSDSRALQQHLSSPAHNFECDECNKSFNSQQALQQHLSSPAHNFECDECNKSFNSQQALQQHLSSPAHNFECDECNKSFNSQQALEQHLSSPAHNFECDECNKSFNSQQALEQHLSSPAHNFVCDKCNKSFNSQQALKQHLSSLAHNFDCDECDRSFNSHDALYQHVNSVAHIPDTTSRYSGIPRLEVESVFAIARRLRHQQPTIGDVLRQSKFQLEDTVVSAIISAALRLLPINDTAQGIALRTEKHRIKAAEAKLAEDGFCTKLTRFGHIYLREDQQLGDMVTPDVRFQKPTLICGHLCLWLEYKNYFGFRSNPFVAASTKKQLRKYATQIGPGAVVYRLGYETSHLNIDGVMSFREKEVLQDL